jgi:hypothetical protein
MLKLFISFFTCFFPIITFGQTFLVHGNIQDTENHPLSGVLISASSPDNALLAYTISSDEGEYEISIESPFPSQSVILHTSHISYSDTAFSITLTEGTHTKNLVLKEEQYVIDDVEVTAKRLPLRMEDGKIIAEVSQIPGFQSADIQKILNRLPGVTANSRQGISFNGQNASIYIDGRKQNMRAEQVLNFLKSLPADAIRNIVINSMDLASYDASSGVVIDIKTKTTNIDGYYASIAGNIKRFDNKETGEGVQGFYIFQKNNFVFNTTISYADVYKHSTSEDSTLYNNGNKTRLFNSFESLSNIFTTTTNLNWQLKNSTLNANFFVYYEKGDKNSETPTTTYLPEKNHYTQISKGNLHDDLWSGHIEYQTNDSLPLSTKLSYGIIYGGLRSSSSFEQSGRTDDLTSFDSDYSMVGHRHTLKADIKYNLGEKTILDAGLVGKSGKLDDLVLYTPKGQQAFPLEDSDFTGSEVILGAYSSVKYSFSQKWSAKIALRAEFSDNEFILKKKNRTINVNYSNWFPHLSTTYLGENYQTSFGLVSNIAYPDYEKILPATRYVNDFLQSKGTVNVKPVKIYRLGWNQIFHQYFYIFSHYQLNKDQFGTIAFNMEDDLTEYRYINYADQHNLAATIGIPFEFFDKTLSGKIEPRFTYSWYSNSQNYFIIPENRNGSFSNRVQVSLQYEFHERFSVYAWGQVTGERTLPQYTIEAKETLDLGMFYTGLKDKNLTISLDVENIFDTSDEIKHLYYGGTTKHTRFSPEFRNIKLSVLYKFSGGKKVEDKAKGNMGDVSRFSRE